MIKIVCLRIALLAPMVMWLGCTSAPPPRNAVLPVSHAPNIAGVRVAAWLDSVSYTHLTLPTTPYV